MDDEFIKTTLNNWNTLGEWDYDKVVQHLKTKYKVHVIHSENYSEETFAKIACLAEKTWTNKPKNKFIHDMFVEATKHNTTHSIFLVRKCKTETFVSESIIRLSTLYKTRYHNVLKDWINFALDVDVHDYVFKFKYWELYLFPKPVDTHATPELNL